MSYKLSLQGIKLNLTGSGLSFSVGLDLFQLSTRPALDYFVSCGEWVKCTELNRIFIFSFAFLSLPCSRSPHLSDAHFCLSLRLAPWQSSPLQWLSISFASALHRTWPHSLPYHLHFFSAKTFASQEISLVFFPHLSPKHSAPLQY